MIEMEGATTDTNHKFVDMSERRSRLKEGEKRTHSVP